MISISTDLSLDRLCADERWLLILPRYVLSNPDVAKALGCSEDEDGLTCASVLGCPEDLGDVVLLHERFGRTAC